MADAKPAIVLIGAKCVFSGGEEDVFVDPYSIESVRSVKSLESPGDRSCLIRMKSGEEFRCGHTAEEFIDGLRRTLAGMSATAGQPWPDPPAIGHPEGVQVGGFARQRPGDRRLAGRSTRED
jgi:hypothetical protein